MAMPTLLNLHKRFYNDMLLLKTINMRTYLLSFTGTLSSKMISILPSIYLPPSFLLFPNFCKEIISIPSIITGLTSNTILQLVQAMLQLLVSQMPLYVHQKECSKQNMKSCKTFISKHNSLIPNIIKI